MNRILYLHGFASSPASSKARFFAQYLRDRGATVDIPDLAAGDFENLTLTSQLEVIERAAAGEPAVLIGSSMGGYLAAIYAQYHPEVARLILLAPAFCFARRWAERLGEKAMAEWRDAGTINVFHYGENRARSLAYSLFEDARQFPDYPDVRQPALIFHGKHDDIVPAQFSVEFAATHPNARLEIVDSGHELINVLDYMAPKVGEFLLTD
uniref:Esterase n=1 Tax=Solibacter usitatus (strain Ellin6076) TaxID=234267 RepID=Q02AB9_SOLUE